MLKGRRALVTGGNTGIGRAIAEALSDAGASVVVCSRTRRAGRLPWIRADVTREEDVRTLARETRRILGKLDILVNNVGGLEEFDSFSNLTLVQWRAMFDVNLFSAVAVTGEFLADLKRSKAGRVINIASYTGREPPVRAPHYNAAKAALLNWTKSLSRELAPRVTVNAIAPGMVLTDSWVEEAQIAAKKEGRPWGSILKEIQKDSAARIPMGRMGRPSDIAPMAVLLASDQGAWITGSNLVIDGGASRSI